MSWKTYLCIPLAIAASWTASCNTEIIGGGGGGTDPDCPEGMTCPNPNPDNPMPPKETTVKVGPGEGSSPFDPRADGSGGVILDDKGNVILDPKGGGSQSQSIIWVANSADGTVSKIDTRSLRQLARYSTCPGGKCDPSRTTVSLNGDVVVANRAWQNGAASASASAVFIAGDRGACVDRNNNGKIDTYEGEGAVPAAFAWPAGQGKSPDECVLWVTPLDKDGNGNTVGGEGTRPRAAGFDSNLSELQLARYVYIGLFDLKEVVRLDIRTGAVVKRISVAPTAPYGLVLDRSGRVWVMGRETEGGTLTSIDVAKGDAVKTYNVPTNSAGQPCNYGITADARGYIYTSWTNCVARFNPQEEKFETLVVQGAGRLRGLALDNTNQLWVADDQLGMHHIDASPAPRAGGGASTLVYRRLVDTRVNGAATNNVGAAIDTDNKPWTISQSNRAIRVEPAAYTIMANMSVNGSYTYSDMTGYQLRNATRAGVFRKTFEGCPEGGVTVWTKLTFALSAPNGTKATIRYRGATNAASLMNATWVSVTGDSPLTIMLPPGPASADPRLLQVEVNMSSVDASVTPILSELSAAYICKVIVG